GRRTRPRRRGARRALARRDAPPRSWEAACRLAPSLGVVVPARQLDVGAQVVAGDVRADELIRRARGVLVAGIEEKLGAVAAYGDALPHPPGNAIRNLGGLKVLLVLARRPLVVEAEAPRASRRPRQECAAPRRRVGELFLERPFATGLPGL